MQSWLNQANASTFMGTLLHHRVLTQRVVITDFPLAPFRPVAGVGWSRPCVEAGRLDGAVGGLAGSGPQDVGLEHLWENRACLAPAVPGPHPPPASCPHSGSQAPRLPPPAPPWQSLAGQNHQILKGIYDTPQKNLRATELDQQDCSYPTEEQGTVTRQAPLF